MESMNCSLCECQQVACCLIKGLVTRGCTACKQVYVLCLAQCMQSELSLCVRFVAVSQALHWASMAHSADLAMHQGENMSAVHDLLRSS